MAVKFEKRGNALRVMIQGDFDMKICPQLKKEIDTVLDREMIHHVIFDLTFVPFIDSSGLGVILGRYRKLAPTGGKVTLVGANKQVYRILELSGFTKVMSVEKETMREAR